MTESRVLDRDMHLFISDLHLSSERPHITDKFFAFLHGAARSARALYVLGDLFDACAGDDDLGDPLNRDTTAALRGLSSAGVAVFLMHGNRDFLFGKKFAASCGATLLSDPSLVDVCGTRTLLMHGDTLCTDDVAYQRFRAKVRHPLVQAAFRMQPLSLRKKIIGGLRSTSESAKAGKPEVIMDVATTTVERTLRDFGYPRLIHGHTHRPARHLHEVDGHLCERWVLGDWYKRGSYLVCDAAGCRVIDL